MIKKLLPLAFVLLLTACAMAQPQTGTACCTHCQECACAHCQDGVCMHDETGTCKCCKNKDMHEKMCMKHKA